jgi:UDP-N-acetylglucosamine--N-acetylmuramyl-(pentapeptide) pyrophosphoryl-undecaprenol N-acetylglucosamine transferase
MKIVLAGGGTGGHLIPGISLAQTIRQELPQSEIYFLSKGNALEHRLCEQYEFPLYPVAAKPLSKNPWKLAGFAYQTFKGTFQARRFLQNFQPDAIIGLGGYGSAPALFAGHSLKIPLFLLEQNAIPGIVNQWVAPYTQKVFCQFEQVLPYFGNKGVLAGNPLRLALTQPVIKAREKLGLDPQRLTLLIMGGSQGAQALNSCMEKSISKVVQHLKTPLQILHLAGSEANETLEKAYQNAGVPYRIFSFLPEMEWAYASSDLAIARAGGTSIAEMTAWGLPSILIPYPHAKADHQFLNARELVQKGAALVFRENQWTPERLVSSLSELLETPGKLQKMSASAKALGKPHAGQDIFQQLSMCLKAKNAAVGVKEPV